MLYEYLSNQITLLEGFIYLLAIILSLTLHEFSHALSAKLLGDNTPNLQGRISLNPLSHIDPIGLIALILTNFGWGKPVQINPNNFKRPYMDSAIVSIMGPISNLLISFFSTVLLKFFQGSININGVYFLEILIFLNIGLALFNLIPFPPLDGSKVLALFLPLKYKISYETLLNRYTIILWILLILPIWNGSSLVSLFLIPLIDKIANIFAIILNL